MKIKMCVYVLVCVCAVCCVLSEQDQILFA